jgi:LysR family transcriptional activator of mexEF-oprN operon
MMPSNLNNLYAMDLNLLVAFEALVSDQSVTKAAARVGIGQSAMSHNLARLRTLFGDELLTRGSEGMRLTPRAQSLAEPVRAILGQIQALTARPAAFEPSLADRIFRLGLPDSVEVLLVPHLLAYLQAEAPGVRLRLQAVGHPAQVLEDLDADRLDMAISLSGLEEGRDHHKTRSILTGTYMCMFNAALVGIEPPISLEDYVRLPHVLTSLRQGERGVVDQALEEIGQKRNVTLVTPRFLAVPFLVRGAPVVTTMHAELARLFAATMGLTLSPPPLKLPGIAISLIWHSSYDDDVGHAWLRRVIARIAAEVTKEQTA